MKKISFRNKVCLIIFGIFLAGALVEAGLHAGHFLYILHDYMVYADLPAFSRIGSDECVVFCLGDSFTYGMGAGFDRSYPAQLESILNAEGEGKKFKVINLGIPGYNSRQVVARFKKALSRVTPDIVVVTMGMNDRWRRYPTLWEKFPRLACRVKTLQCEIKIGTFFRILAYNLRQTMNNFRAGCSSATSITEGEKKDILRKGNVLREQGLYDEAMSCYERVSARDPLDKTAFIEMGRNLKLQKNYAPAAEILIKTMELHGDTSDVCEELADVLIRQNDIAKTTAVYSLLVKRFPGNEYFRIQLSKAYQNWGGRYVLKAENPRRAEELYSQAIAFKSADMESWRPLLKEIAGYSSIYSSESFAQHREIIRLCRKKNIKLIISSYPRCVHLFAMLAAQQYGIEFVDHRSVFAERIAAASLERYIVSKTDIHCTAEGYWVMADNIAKHILNADK